MLRTLFKPLFLMAFATGYFFISTFCVAAPLPVETILNDLSPIEATVIIRPDGRLLLNKGSVNGVRRGDLWRIHGKGEMIKDPSSGKALGRLDETIGIGKTIRADKQFCEIKLIQTGKVPVKPAQQALRYDGIAALFLDATGTHYGLYETLRAGLPALTWQGYKKINPNSPALPVRDTVVFSAQKDRFIVWSGGEILNAYNGAQAKIPTGTTNAQDSIKKNPLPAPESTKAVSTPLSAPGPIIKPITSPVPGLQTPGLSADIISQKYRSVGSLDRIVYQLDMMRVNNTEKTFFIYLTDKGLFAQPVLGRGKTISYRFEGFGRVAGISIGQNGMIAMNVFNQSEWEMTSLLLRFSGEHFEVLGKDINYILAFIDINNNGTKALVGQNFDNETYFGSGVYELKWHNNRLSRVKTLPLPPTFQIYGAFWADMDNDNVVENGFYNPGRRLVLYEKGKEIWQSTSPFGGSIQGVSINNIESEGATARNEIIWSPAAVVPYARGQFVALAYNDTSLLNLVGVRPQKGKVSIFYKARDQYFFRVLDAGFEGPVQSVFVWKDELYCAIVEGNVFSGRGRTHVIAFSLDEVKTALK